MQITEIINDMEDIYTKKDVEIQQTFDKALLEYNSPVELSGTEDSHCLSVHICELLPRPVSLLFQGGGTPASSSQGGGTS